MFFDNMLHNEETTSGRGRHAKPLPRVPGWIQLIVFLVLLGYAGYYVFQYFHYCSAHHIPLFSINSVMRPMLRL
jgi:hypothetical protein